MKIENLFQKQAYQNEIDKPHLILSPLIDILKVSDLEDKFDLPSKEELSFCYKVAKGTIESCLNGTFTDFDALTTTNCCHGVSLFLKEKLSEVLRLNLHEIFWDCDNKLKKLSSINNFDTSFCECYVPQPLIDLCRLYILTLIKEIDYQRGGWKTVYDKLIEIAPISAKFSKKIVNNVQTYLSNTIADGYYSYLTALDQDLSICSIPLKTWGKYISSNYLRADKRGRRYAACMFSMQVTLAHLIQSRSIIAIVNDLQYKDGNNSNRYIQFLRGDGISNFSVIAIEELHANVSHSEPIIVFGGCSYLEEPDIQIMDFQMSPWLDCFPNLVLACDIFYPQFPRVGDDPDFDNSPIQPIEDSLQQLIETHSKILGVSISDPSLFCLSHIYVASLEQILRVYHQVDKMALPLSFLSEVLRNKSCER